MKWCKRQSTGCANEDRQQQHHWKRKPCKQLSPILIDVGPYQSFARKFAQSCDDAGSLSRLHDASSQIDPQPSAVFIASLVRRIRAGVCSITLGCNTGPLHCALLDHGSEARFHSRRFNGTVSSASIPRQQIAHHVSKSLDYSTGGSTFVSSHYIKNSSQQSS